MRFAILICQSRLSYSNADCGICSRKRYPQIFQGCNLNSFETRAKACSISMFSNNAHVGLMICYAIHSTWYWRPSLEAQVGPNDGAVHWATDKSWYDDGVRYWDYISLDHLSRTGELLRNHLTCVWRQHQTLKRRRDYFLKTTCSWN